MDLRWLFVACLLSLTACKITAPKKINTANPKQVAVGFLYALGEGNYTLAKELSTSNTKAWVQRLENLMDLVPTEEQTTQKDKTLDWVKQIQKIKCQTNQTTATCTFCCQETLPAELQQIPLEKKGKKWLVNWTQ